MPYTAKGKGFGLSRASAGNYKRLPPRTMLKFPAPTPFSPTQEDLDRLVAALTPEHQALAQAEADGEMKELAKVAPQRWDQRYSFKHRFGRFFSHPGMGIKNVAFSLVVSLFVVLFRLLFLPLQLAILIARLPFRPAKDTYHSVMLAERRGQSSRPGTFAPVQLDRDSIRSFDDLTDKVISYEQMLEYANYGSSRKMDLLAICAGISPRLVEPHRLANFKRNQSVKEANKRRHEHFVGKAGVTFREPEISPRLTPHAFINRLTLEQQEAKETRERKALLNFWAPSASVGDGFCPFSFRYEYHAVDAKPHTVRIVFDFTSRILRTSRHEVRHLEREEGGATFLKWKITASPDYLPDEETGHFERKPSAKLWQDFAEYLIAEKMHERGVSLNEAAVRDVSWTLDVDFGDYEVHVGDSQTGAIGDKLSLMVGRLIA